MTILQIIAACGSVLILGYLFYGRLLSRWMGIDPNRPTPAVQMEDGVDYVPAAAPVVLGGHFTAIAAAGPVVGPILAGLAFGWLPALLWIVIGSIFIGGVHDSGSLLASIRHNATSITQIVRQHMSRTAYFTFLIFVWLSLLYVIVAFTDVTAGSFARFQKDVIAATDADPAFHLNGGAVAIGATAYLISSILLGLILRYTKTPWWAGLALFVVLVSLCIWKASPMAIWLSHHGLPFMDASRYRDAAGVLLTKRWDQALLVYCFIASVTPMWLLLQPRGLIGATFLYATLVFGVAGTIAGTIMHSPSLTIHYPAFIGWHSAKLGYLFPFLFITIACGACSGFHSIVSSGTTCKQIRSERHIKPVAYGAMLMEAMVAIFALTCVMILSRGQTGSRTPDVIYALGIGNFMDLCGIDRNFAVSFGLLAFSSFVFDTLDVCTRLGRYVFQELVGLKGVWGGALATLITLAGPAIYLWIAPTGAFLTFWIIFGTSNQLLAALTLVGVSVWLWRTGRRVWYALVPAIFMLLSTGTALVLNFLGFLKKYRLLSPQQIEIEAKPLIINMVLAVVLFALAGLVVGEAIRVWRRSRNESARGFDIAPAASPLGSALP